MRAVAHDVAIQEESGAHRYRGSVLDLRGIRVLVVDDDEDLLEMLDYVLREARAEVWLARTVDEAMERFRDHPDVIVSDIGLPDRDGYQLLRMIRARPVERGGATPAIALTGRTRTVDESLAYLSGYQAYFAKPVRPAELLVAIRSVVDEARRS